MSERNAMKG